MDERAYLGEFEVLILASLMHLGDDAYGVRVRELIAERTGRDVSIGAVYTTLGRLEGKGYIRSTVGEPTPERGGRAKRYSALEPAGQKVFDDALVGLTRMTTGLVPKWQNP